MANVDIVGAEEIVVGTVFEDIGDAVKKVTGMVSDAFNDVFSAIPGSGWLKDLVNGPLKDFAKGDVGKVVLRAIATTLTGGLAPLLGPQLATVAWSLPGLVRGEPFDKAWFDEFAHRVEQTGQIMGGEIGQQLAGMFKVAGDYITNMARQQFPNLPIEQAIQALDISPEQLAQTLGIRPDVAAMAASLAKRIGLVDLSRYDIATGMPTVGMRKTTAEARAAQTLADANMTPCDKYQRALQMGTLKAVMLEPLRLECEKSRSIQMRLGKPVDAAEKARVDALNATLNPCQRYQNALQMGTLKGAMLEAMRQQCVAYAAAQPKGGSKIVNNDAPPVALPAIPSYTPIPQEVFRSMAPENEGAIRSTSQAMAAEPQDNTKLLLAGGLGLAAIAYWYWSKNR